MFMKIIFKTAQTPVLCAFLVVGHTRGLPISEDSYLHQGQPWFQCVLQFTFKKILGYTLLQP
jgi:hypothetical protein